MVKGKAGLIIDLGNSETRVLTLFGKSSKGNWRRKISSISNKVGVIPTISLLENANYNEENSKVFEFEGKKYCSGLMCDREVGGSAMRPSVSVKKYLSDNSKYSLQLAFLQGLLDVAQLSNTVDLSDLDIEWNVTVLLPPSDLEESGVVAMSKLVAECSKINFLMPELSMDLGITQEDVTVLPEGFCAWIGLLYDSKYKLRKEYFKHAKEKSLIIDIGAGTTDFCIIEDNALLDISRFTEDTGGNQVFQRLGIMLKKTTGISFSEDALRECAITGYIKRGGTNLDVSEGVAKAKNYIATKLINSLKAYLEGAGVQSSDITNILICGGGATASDNDKILSLGENLENSLKEWLPYVNFLELPIDTVGYYDEEGTLHSNEEKISTRLLNLVGASALYVAKNK